MKKRLPKKTEKVRMPTAKPDLQNVTLPLKTEKVLRDMAKDPVLRAMERDGIILENPPHVHTTNCMGCKVFLMDHRPNQPFIMPHEHDPKACATCDDMWTQGEAFGRENHVVTKCNHPEPKPIVIGTPFSVHIAWFWTAAILALVAFCVGYGPNWAGAVR